MRLREVMLFFIAFSAVARGAEEKSIQSAEVRPSPLRLRMFAEMMLPAMDDPGDGKRGFVPRPSGTSFVPAFLSAQLGIDYEFAPDLRVFYLQKGLAIMPKEVGAPITGRFLDPRVGLRKSNVFGSSVLAAEYDLFLQPGFLPAFVMQPQRSFDLGMRFTHRFQSPGSRLTLGLNFEVVFTSYSEMSQSSNLTGVIAPWASYRLGKRFSTQHWIYGFYKHMRGAPLLEFSWDIMGMPYIQNGLTFDLSPQMGVSLLLNNYLGALPTLRTTWSSLWFSFRI